MGINAKHTKASSSTGTNAPKVMDGYAKGPVPKAMIGTKVGKVGSKGYTGPNVATGRHDGA